MKSVLVTGATDGIGRQTALDLARKGFRVLVHGRTSEKAALACSEIAALTPGSSLLPVAGDLSDLAQVRLLAGQVRANGPLAVLVNNAGVYMTERVVTTDGFESTFAINHLAPFLLTNLLLDHLHASAPARIVTVSSVAHTRGSIVLDDLQGERRFDGYAAYAQSKLANVLFAVELARRIGGDGVTSNVLHPGVISTKLLRKGFSIEGESIERGAETSVFLASSTDVERISGAYFQSKRQLSPSPVVNDVSLRTRLWTVSQQLTGLGVS